MQPGKTFINCSNRTHVYVWDSAASRRRLWTVHIQICYLVKIYCRTVADRAS